MVLFTFGLDALHLARGLFMFGLVFVHIQFSVDLVYVWLGPCLVLGWLENILAKVLVIFGTVALHLAWVFF